MADQNLAVAIIFNAVDNLGGTLKGIDDEFGTLSGKVESFAAPFASFTDSLLKAEAALLALGVAMVALSVDKAGKFGDQIAEIGTLFGGTSQQMGKFSDDVLAYGATSSKSLEEINQAVYSSISAGTKYEDSLGLVAQAEKLSVAGRADLGEVTKVLTGALNAYGESTESAGKFSDVLFQTVKSGQTTLPELSASLGQITSIAANAGVPFGDLGAAIATLTSKGVGTSEAITGIKAALSNIIQPTSEAEKAAGALGVSFGIAEVKSKGLDGVLKELMQATGGNVDEMAKFFGSVEGLNTVMALGQDGAAKFSSSIGDMANSTGATEKAFGAMADNYAVSMQKMANSADVAMIKFGKPMLDQFGGVAEAIGGIFKGLGSGIDEGAFAPILNALQGFGDSVADTLNNIGTNLPDALAKLDFTDMIRSFGDLGDEVGNIFDKMFGDVDLNTPEGLAEALQKVVDIITGLVDVTRGIATEFEPLFAAFGALADKSGEAGEEANVMAGKFLGSMKMIADFGLAIGGLATALQDSGANVKGFVTDVFSAVDGAFNGLQALFDTIMGGLALFVKDFVEVIDTLTLGAFHEKLGDVSKNLDGIMNDFAESASRNSDEAVAAFGKIGDGMDAAVGDDTEKTWNEAAAAVEKIGINAGEAATETSKFEPIDLGDLDPVAEAMKRLGMSAKDTAEATKEMAEAAQVVAPEWASAEDKARGYKVVMDDMGKVTFQQVGGAIKDTDKTLDDHGKALDEAAKKAEKAQEAAQKYALEMEKLASNERIKFIEATVQLNIAQLQADTETVKAAFASIDNTVTSTGDLLGNLFGQLSGADLTDKFGLERQIDLENKRRQDALDLQKKLVEAQVLYMNKRAEALGKGDALITIQADGLEPQLEAIWVEIMRKIQVKAAEEGLEMLLGAMG